MSCWSRLAQQVHILSLRSSKPTRPRLVAQNCGIFLSTFQYLWDFCWTEGCLPDCISVQLRARYSLPFTQSSAVRYRPSERSSSSNRCVSLAQKISNRTHCPILVRKLFTHYVLHPIPFLDE